MASSAINFYPPSLYTPLDEHTSQFRLIHLQPHLSPTSNEIVCSLHLANLDDEEGQYEALSYEWGDPEKSPMFIELNGERRAVRENLWWALWHLRDEKDMRILWIDALCINQEKELEKNHQVSHYCSHEPGLFQGWYIDYYLNNGMKRVHCRVTSLYGISYFLGEANLFIILSSSYS